MELSCSTWSFRKAFNSRELDLLGIVDLSAEIGLDAVEILTAHFPAVSRKYLRELRGRLDRRLTRVSALAVANDFAHPDATERARQCEDVLQWINVARDLGVPRIRTFTGRLPKGADPAPYKAWVIECYGRVLPAAERANVILAVENHSGVMLTADELVEMVMHFGSGCLQLNPDPANFLERCHEKTEAEREIVYRELAKVARFAAHAHLKIRDFDSVGRPTTLDVTRMLDIYRKACYDGAISFEFFGMDGAREAVEKGIACLRPLIGD